MVKKNKESSACCQKYGVPIFGASWVPTKSIFSKGKPSIGDDDQQQQPETTELTQLSLWLVFCGGGGEGKNGIPNSLLLSQFDLTSNSLSPNLMARLGTDADVPYRMAVHPGGEGVICSFPKSCRWSPENMTKGSDEGIKRSNDTLRSFRKITETPTLGKQFANSRVSVECVSHVLQQIKWGSMAEEALKNLNCQLDAYQANQNLKQLHDHSVALGFFYWLKRQAGFKHDGHSCWN